MTTAEIRTTAAPKLRVIPKDLPFPYGSEFLPGFEGAFYEGLRRKDQALLIALFERHDQRPRIERKNGYSFRNSEIAELAAPRYTLDSLNILEEHLRKKGTLSMPTRWGEIEREGKKQRILTIPATSADVGWPMNQVTWTRDQAQSVRALMEMHQCNSREYQDEGVLGRELLLGILTVNSTPAQLQRFKKVIANPQGYKDLGEYWPQIFRDINNLDGEGHEGWDHRQDAWQMLAVTTLSALDKRFIPLDRLSDNHKQFLSLTVPFLTAIDFTTQEYTGSWEEIAARRTSCMAWDTKVIEAIGNHASKEGFEFLEQGWDEQKRNLPPQYQNMSLREACTNLVEQGLASIADRLPNESPDYEAGSYQKRGADAALLYLLDLDIPKLLVETPYLIKSYERDLLGSVLKLSDNRTQGIRRYGEPGDKLDTYQMQGFWTNKTQEQLSSMYGTSNPEYLKDVLHFVGRDRMSTHGTAASWAHFNPQISAWASERYLQTGDNEYLNIAQNFLNRSLAMITGEGEYTLRPGSEGLILTTVYPNLLPECFVYHQDPRTRREIATPSPHTPLTWGITNLSLSLAKLKLCVS